MQSNATRAFFLGDIPVFLVALAIGGGAAVIAIAGHQGTAALFLELMAGLVLGFTRPRGAWRWALALASWVPLCAVLQLPLPASGTDVTWCPPAATSQAVPPALVAAVLFATSFAAVYLGVAADWLLSLALLFSAARLLWLRHAKPVLRRAAVVLCVAIALFAAASQVQPLEPYGLGERYCWDEFCFSVESVSRVKSLEYQHHRADARGEFYVLTARMETPWWGRFPWSPDAVYVTDYNGTNYRYSNEGQAIVDLKNHKAPGCHEVPGAAEKETIVFDLPSGIEQPRLQIRDTLGFEGLLGAWRAKSFSARPGFNLRYD